MVQLVHRRSEDAVRIGEERYRLLAENATDLITRHDEKGRVVFASLAAQQLFGEPAQKITGDGLFERVHVADRPAYLTALSRSLADNEPMAVEFRVRRAGPAEAARYVWVEMRCRPATATRARGARRVPALSRSRATSPSARRKRPSSCAPATRPRAQAAPRRSSSPI